MDKNMPKNKNQIKNSIRSLAESIKVDLKNNLWSIKNGSKNTNLIEKAMLKADKIKIEIDKLYLNNK